MAALRLAGLPVSGRALEQYCGDTSSSKKQKISLARAPKTSTFLRFMSKENKTPNRSLNPMDYTFNDVEQLSRFVTETGKILPRKVTGLSAKHQRRITNRIKQARNMLTMQ